MEIGILTYHRAHNYGALLQAIALRHFLSRLGHEVFYVDYRPTYIEKAYELFDWDYFFLYGRFRGFKHKYYYLKSQLSTLSYRYKRRNRFLSFIRHYITPYSKGMTQSYDLIIYGSDQIWRKTSRINAYDPIYFGDNSINAKKHISYAASGTIPTSANEIECIKKLLSNLSGISVRENVMKEFCVSIGYKNTTASLDPTLLLKPKVWNSIFPVKKNRPEKKYILFYDLVKDYFNEEELRDYARRKGLNFISFRGYAMDNEAEDNITSGDPYAFIDLIRNAEIVFTNSFHGTVFSIIYHKLFFTCTEHNPMRVKSLLQDLGLEQQYITPMAKIPQITQNINWEEIDKKIEKQRILSKKYLIDIIDAL